MLLEGEGCREWMSTRIAAWLDVLAVELLGYALMGNHLHLVVRTRPDFAKSLTLAELRRRWVALSTVSDGQPGLPSAMPVGHQLDAEGVAHARAVLSHPGTMLRAVKEGFARRLNRQQGAAGHVWESRYHDVAVVDAGGVLACLIYVDLNPMRAGLVDDPTDSHFCSARHRRTVDSTAPDAALGVRLCRLTGHPLLDATGEAQGSWSWSSDDVAELTHVTAQLIRGKKIEFPIWAEDLMPRLGIARAKWCERMAVGGTIAGNVLGSYMTRRALAGKTRMASDKSGWFG